jgi:sulfate/thiosulfate transport system permease protein
MRDEPGNLRSRGWVSYVLIGVTVAFLTLFIILPVGNVFAEALGKGWGAYRQTFVATPAPRPQTQGLPIHQRLAALKAYRDANRPYEEARKNWSAIRMTLGVAAIVVPLNVLFGVAAAWAVAKHRFKGKSLLMALIDLPFSFSPVVAGLMFVLLFGRVGVLEGIAHASPHLGWLSPMNWSYPIPTTIQWRGFSVSHWWPIGFGEWERGVLFTPIAAVIGSVFITFPFVARSLIPLMESQGTDAELAAITLGAGGWQTFRRVTLPNIKWGLLYGVILCNARAMGEFGAISVMIGNRDATNTIPLRVETLNMEAHLQAAFAVASLLTVVAVLTLILKTYLEWKTRGEREVA